MWVLPGGEAQGAAKGFLTKGMAFPGSVAIPPRHACLLPDSAGGKSTRTGRSISQEPCYVATAYAREPWPMNASSNRLPGGVEMAAVVGRGQG